MPIFIQDVQALKLTGVEKALVAKAINEFSEGQHPYADRETVPFFEVRLARECVAKAAAKARLDGGFAGRILGKLTL